MGVLFWATIGSLIVRESYRRDFLNLYTGGLLARTGHFADLYDFKLQTTLQDQLIPDLPVHFPFVRPPFYALFLAPISLLPVAVAFPVWLGLQFAGLVFVWRWAWRRFGPESMAYCALFLPTCLGIVYGQDCILLLLVMLAAWTLMERDKDSWAGLVLSLTLFKFHLFLLLPLAIIARGRWKLLGGYAAGGIAMAAVSFVMVGRAGMEGYLALLTRKDLSTLAPSPGMMVGMNAVAVNLGLDSGWLVALLTAGAVGLVVWAARRPGADLYWFWTAVVGSMLVSPHTYEYDLSALLVPTLMVAFSNSRRSLRIAGALTLMPVPYLATVAPAPLPITPSLVVIAFMIALSGAGLRLLSPRVPAVIGLGPAKAVPEFSR